MQSSIAVQSMQPDMAFFPMITMHNRICWNDNELLIYALETELDRQKINCVTTLK